MGLSARCLHDRRIDGLVNPVVGEFVRVFQTLNQFLLDGWP
jgi:hypothetical protein